MHGSSGYLEEAVRIRRMYKDFFTPFFEIGRMPVYEQK